MSSVVPNIILNNKLSIPQLGLGVWQANDGSEVEAAILSAITAGYRLIDTATAYGNEGGVGRAIKASGVPREELFITTKLRNDSQGYDKTLAAFDESMKLLDLEYLDMYLIHWPQPSKGLYLETWKAMEELHKQGRVKTLGVCNFQISHLQNLMEHATVQPAVNQVELHPYFPQTELRKFANDHNIAIESWSPIGGSGGAGGRSTHDSPLLDQPILLSIGQQYGKTPAQVVLRWHIQNGLIVIPKSVHEDRIKQNIDVFDFELTTDDMNSINGLETGKRGGPDPDTFFSN
ncbi:aldo/keto reductase [Patescibacteria group bacterium]|nr:MAG: aldo/keto reductase [Patescibacteria group bacterium]